jgi:hypothetical protein
LDIAAERSHHGHIAVRQELLGYANARVNDFRSLLDMRAGMPGLKFQRQFALEFIDENCVVVREPNRIIEYLEEWLDVLEKVSPNESGVEAMRGLSPVVGEIELGGLQKLERSLEKRWRL